MVKVLDASALMAYLEKETGYDKVRDFFIKASESGKHILMSTVNWGEVLYVLIRDHGLEEAQKIEKIVETFPIEFVPVDLAIAKQAALYKAIKKLPYADCFVAALAKTHKGELVTGDKEFKLIENEIKVIWV
ncbi:MAG: type II toxin-antitoxin system VapC family toxin [Candidatus Omnitrophica bacterium]|nr:type II toxin-antitoxin system VapC family toxin [Candidatus Omnitrophota bacterium]